MGSDWSSSGCLLDSGAEKTLVTEDTTKAVELAGVATNVTVKCIGGIHCTPTLAKTAQFQLSPVKANQRDLDGEPIEALTLHGSVMMSNWSLFGAENGSTFNTCKFQRSMKRSSLSIY
ncbi:hypothetical protein T07_14313 [Trichinella nelsoni]|uniref:Peptidase A2 domain-containing protein n=1 Tax=Trichinella nelsoni TaxID=6336 RepID=A0A0V0RHM6_9BILA|nr:hypothetical protein T07_14313 [Trichinella nelsoni]